jgi:hypothetical protein
MNNLVLKTGVIACVLLLTLVGAKGESGVTISKTDSWNFRNYPSVADFKGMPATPKLVTSKDETNRTQIRAQERTGPNFAGHFTLAKWGCGSPCLDFVIIDARSGVVYDPTFVVGCADKNGLAAKIDFKLTSRLLITTGFRQGSGCDTNYYEWDRKQLTLVHFEPRAKSK